MIDASGLVLGRTASQIARLLRGKHKRDYTPHADSGDAVVVVNADKIALTGKKLEQKTYHRHSGFPGGIKTTSVEAILRGPHPERVLESAIKRMMPDGPLATAQLKRLRVYSGPDHPHSAQQPTVYELASLNPKNVSQSERRDSMKSPYQSPLPEQLRSYLREDFDAVGTAVKQLADQVERSIKKNTENSTEIANMASRLSDFHKLANAEYEANDSFRREFHSYKENTEAELKGIRENTEEMTKLLRDFLNHQKL